MENFYKGLFLVGSGLLLLIGLLAFEKSMRTGDKARLYLVMFMAMAAFYYASYGVYLIAPMPYSEYGNIIRLPIVLSFIPLFFLFLRDLITGNTQKFKYVVKHLILPVLFLATIPFLLIFSSQIELKQIRGINLIHRIAQIILIIQTVVYTLRMFRRYARYSGKFQVYCNDTHNRSFKIRNLLVAFVLFLLVLDNWLMSLIIPPGLFAYVYPVLLWLAAALTGWLGLIAESRLQHAESPGNEAPAIVHVNKPILPSPVTQQESVLQRVLPVIPMANIDSEQIENNNVIDNNISFDGEKRKILHASLIKYMEEKEPFVDPKLSIKQLSTELDTNTRYLSMVINDFEHCNFNQLVNKYRINKVIRLLVDNQAKSYSFFGLAQKAGFHSKSVFISSFKAHTGQTPTAFANSMKKLIQI